MARIRSSSPRPFRAFSAPALAALPWAAGLLCASLAHLAVAQTGLAQTPGASSPAAESTQTVTVSGSAGANSASLAGFGDTPLSRSPFSATVISTRQLQDAGIASLADITRLDAGITDAYNAPGYVGTLAVRGFTVDNRYNIRRDGLPISGETVLPAGNKAAIEILKGTSGLQAGTSAPGGLVNLVVARPVGELRRASLSLTQPGSVGLALDLGDRSTGAQAVGWRLRLDGDRLDPATRSSRGERWLSAVAMDWRPAAGHWLEAEAEISHQSQPSTPGFSLLGSRLPDAQTVDPRTNLNNQRWSLPVVFNGRTGSLRYTAELAGDTRLVAQAMRQQLRTDDRIAFPFGCSSENDYSRYCSDGRFDLYDFRSEGERRTSDALSLAFQGQTHLAGLQHRYQLSLLKSRYQARYQLQAYNWVGEGRIDGTVQLPEDPSLLDQNTQRDERSTELALQDAVTLSPHWQLWAGLRHTRLDRRSVRTNGSRPTAYDRSFNTPWFSLAWTPSNQGLAYASLGHGIETEVVPNRPSLYSNAGQSMVARSRQFELGWKQRGPQIDWQLAAFTITRPATNTLGGALVLDGQARHTGLEAEADWRIGALSLRGSATVLKARREDSADSGLNGKRPTNVPTHSLKLQAAYNLRQVPGLALLGFITHEGERMVLPDNSIATPGWTRLDLAARYRTQWQGSAVLWRVGLDNLSNHRAWKEAPFQYEHAYLYPLAPRTLSASMAISF